MYQNINRKKTKAFSLIELIIAILTLGIIMLALTNLLVSALRVNYLINAKTQVVGELDFAITVIRSNIQSADSALSEMCKDDGLYLGLVGGQDSVVFKYGQNDNVGSIIRTNNPSISANDVYIVGKETNVSSLTFECASIEFGNDIVIVTIEASPTYGPFSGEVKVVRQAEINTETFQVGYNN
ncbi:prepilin-type N-terminal cleavage/methylation domain-containing protein [Candidatus Dojkabacteria bacterium]|nr:prepilin-type N-terminal cleavage/methylation domain-containing protein [Candidatus Dojkabacteria bacterium]